MKFEFRKSSYSGGGASGTCVEVATNVPGIRAIRDSKDPAGAALLVAPARFADFLTAVRAGGRTS